MTSKHGPSRRDVMAATGKIAAASAVAGISIPFVHAGESNTIQIALVGCGDRGTGAAADALRTKAGPTKLVAMADVFQDRLNNSYEYLSSNAAKQLDVPKERRFVDFDGYKKAIDCLKPGDVVIFATPPAFRWVHFGYAIEKGVNVFMEKPVTVDGPSTRKLLKFAEDSEKKKIKVGVGLMCRHCPARRELFDRIKNGEIGDITLLRAYRMHGPLASFASQTREHYKIDSELLYQIRRFHSFLWASGGCFSDFLIHNIDECCWMKDAWPVKALASGGRHYREYIDKRDHKKYQSVDQNFDSYSVEYFFKNGTELRLEGRCIEGGYQKHSSLAHGTKGSAVISDANHFPAKARICKGYDFDDKSVTWRYDKPEGNPYHHEWDHLMQAIRQDKPYNEARRGAEASLVTAMGRLAAHTGQMVTYDQMLNHDHDLGGDLDKLSMDSSAPLKLNADGKYPVPQPGINKKREY